MSRLRVGRRLGALLTLTLAIAAPAGAELVAEQITPESFAARRIGGPDAIGGVGDWYLANELVEFIVDDPARRHAKLNHGGTLVDAGLRGRDGDDQLAQLFPIANLSQRVQLGIDSVRAELDPKGRFARIVVWSAHGLSSIPRGGALARRFDPLVPEPDALARVRIETEYRVQPGEPFVRIATTLRNLGERPAPLFAYGDVWMRGGRSMRSFVGNTLDPERSRGFHHLSFDKDHLLEASDAMAPFTFVAMNGAPGFPPITYALYAPERVADGRVFFGVTGEHVTFANAFVGEPTWRAAGLFRLLQATRHELAPGAAWVCERRLLVTDGGDLASATDRIFAELGFADGTSGIEGRIEPPGLRAAVHVETADGAPVTLAAPALEGAAAGRFRAALPPGDYALTLRAPLREPQRLTVRVEPGAFRELAPVRFAAPGALLFRGAAFADGGPGRVVVEGIAGTPDPVFGAELLDFRIDGEPGKSGSETRDLLFIGGHDDPQRVELPPGRYRLTATRGIEYAIAQREVEIAGPGAEVEVPAFELARVARLQGITSADFHVHAEASDDSAVPNATRLRGFVAEGIDVMVSSDHDHLGSYGPALAALGLEDRIRVIQGVEVTSATPSPAAPYTIGHHNAWPLVYRESAHRRGAPPSQDMSVAELYLRLRREYSAGVVQLNHAFEGGEGVDDGAYFSHLGSAGEPFDASRPISEAPNLLLLERASDGSTRAIDFDAMEVMNGGSFAKYLQLREAWYSLLRQGFRRTATGNSDTHGLDDAPGYPRNYVYTDEGFEAARFDAAVRAGRSFTTNGPLIAAFRVDGARMGELVAAPDGEVTLELAVAAAPWVPVEEVRVLVNGEVARRITELGGPESPLRLQLSEPLRLAGDAFVTVEAGAPLETDRERWRGPRGGDYARVTGGMVPQALTNPIFVDVDGDGRFGAPGLPGEAAGPATRTRPWLVAGLVLLLALVWWRLRARAFARRR